MYSYKYVFYFTCFYSFVGYLYCCSCANAYLIIHVFIHLLIPLQVVFAVALGVACAAVVNPSPPSRPALNATGDEGWVNMSKYFYSCFSMILHS